MSRLFLAVGIALAAAACGGSSPQQGTPSGSAAATGPAAAASGHATLIIFTTNQDKGTGPGQYDTDCVGIVATETLAARRRQAITWRVEPSHGGVSDACSPAAGFDRSQVSLHFADSGAVGTMALNANNGGVIAATVPDGAIEGRHKYQVFYAGIPAGPDPELFIRCPTCGPDGNGP